MLTTNLHTNPYWGWPVPYPVPVHRVPQVDNWDRVCSTCLLFFAIYVQVLICGRAIIPPTNLNLMQRERGLLDVWHTVWHRTEHYRTATKAYSQWKKLKDQHSIASDYLLLPSWMKSCSGLAVSENVNLKTQAPEVNLVMQNSCFTESPSPLVAFHWYSLVAIASEQWIVEPAGSKELICSRRQPSLRR